MSAGDNRKGWEQKVEVATTRVEEDLRKAIAFINDEVVPDVRRNGSAALRTAAAELHRLAEHIDKNSRNNTPHR